MNDASKNGKSQGVQSAPFLQKCLINFYGFSIIVVKGGEDSVPYGQATTKAFVENRLSKLEAIVPDGKKSDESSNLC